MRQKIITILIGALASGFAATSHAQQLGIVLPNSQQTFNHDEIRTGTGLSCRQAAGSNTNIEFGILGRDEELDRRQPFDPLNGSQQVTQGAAVYARITHAIGAPKRLDCARIFELEVERLQAEIEILRLERQYSMEQN